MIDDFCSYCIPRTQFWYNWARSFWVFFCVKQPLYQVLYTWHIENFMYFCKGLWETIFQFSLHSCRFFTGLSPGTLWMSFDPLQYLCRLPQKSLLTFICQKHSLTNNMKGPFVSVVWRCEDELLSWKATVKFWLVFLSCSLSAVSLSLFFIIV